MKEHGKTEQADQSRGPETELAPNLRGGPGAFVWLQQEDLRSHRCGRGCSAGRNAEASRRHPRVERAREDVEHDTRGRALSLEQREELVAISCAPLARIKPKQMPGFDTHHVLRLTE